MFERFKSKNSIPVDIHSHLVPGIDDGVSSWEESMMIIERLLQLGFKGCVTTPHIYNDVYPNNEDDILGHASEGKKLITESGLDFSFHIAAEYYMDEIFLNKIKEGKKLLTIYEKYVLFETGFISRPLIFDEVVFELKARGYKPIIAHPERYRYVLEDNSIIKRWIDEGIFLQTSSLSLVGKYGRHPMIMANSIVKSGYLNFLGSDIHRLSDIPLLEKAIKTKNYQKAQNLSLENYKLVP